MEISGDAAWAEGGSERRQGGGKICRSVDGACGGIGVSVDLSSVNFG